MKDTVINPNKARIKKEITRLNKIFADLDKNKLAAVKSLIQNAAFMSVALEDLQKTISEEGYVCTYQNGESQFGTKKSPEVEIHISMTKNHASVMKQLAELAPPAKKEESKLEKLRNEW